MMHGQNHIKFVTVSFVSTVNPTLTGRGLNPSLCVERQSVNRVSHSTSHHLLCVSVLSRKNFISI